jgi:rhamnogalacturonyl hydrolase YesR
MTGIKPQDEEAGRARMGWKQKALRVGAVACAVLAVTPSFATPASDPLKLAAGVADWQLARSTDRAITYRYNDESYDPRAWEQGAFWIGLGALADHLPRGNHFADVLLAMGKAHRWQPGPRPYHADDQAVAQAYLWAAAHGAGPAARAPTKAKFDAILAAPPRVGLAVYDGPFRKPSDALFMAPPGWLALSAQTGDPRYRDYALSETWATVNFLYDPAERLFFRDSRFFERRDDKGRKLFWSRGNGWVFAGLARDIALLPRGADRTRLEKLFREMAGRLVALQKPDGYWAPSLLAPENSPPESSGTAFFTYGLAWGVKQGLLDKATFEPTARKGWDALVRAIRPDGRLGWVQQVGDRPDIVAPDDTQYYGTGAFLLAATAIADLDAGKGR